MGVRHGDKTSCVTGTEKKEAVHILGMIWVEPGDRQRIAERGRRLFEGKTVFGDVAPSLFWIPLEIHPRHFPESVRPTTFCRSAVWAPPSRRRDPPPMPLRRPDQCCNGLLASVLRAIFVSWTSR
jgi:hypothetical protein